MNADKNQPVRNKKLDLRQYQKSFCKYHLVFAAKYRRQVIYGKIKQDNGKILRELCERKGMEIIEAECCKDHVHMLVRIPPKYSVSEIMGYLKGKSSLMIFDLPSCGRIDFSYKIYGLKLLKSASPAGADFYRLILSIPDITLVYRFGGKPLLQ
jgi:putative transposase